MNGVEKQIRVATEIDVNRVKAFLDQSEVSSEGIEDSIDHFVLMEDVNQEIVATLGIERVEKNGLLRSLVVRPSIGQTDILTLFKSIISLAKDKEMDDLYLATNKESSVTFFELLGFEKVTKEILPKELMESNHFQKLVEMKTPIFLKSKCSVNS